MIDNKFRLVLETWAIFSTRLRGLNEKFMDNHDDYAEWLRKSLIECIEANEIKQALVEMGIDRLTLHYKTRHPAEDWSVIKEWLQVTLPIQEYLVQYEGDLKVYEKNEPSYITYFAEGISGRTTPLQIFFSNENSLIKEEDWLYISEPVPEYLVSITEGNSVQGDFAEEECRKIDEIDCDIAQNVRKTFSKLSGKNITIAGSLGWLRNACRVTLLALKMDDPDIKLPRIVLLSPVYVAEGGNVIGGIAFVGSKLVDNIETSILKTFTDTLVSNIRLREEGLRESRISYLDELNYARAEFVQLIAHSVQNPIEAINTGIDNLKKSAKELGETAIGIMNTFSSENIEDYFRPKPVKTNVKDFIDTLEFRNEMIFQRAGRSLEVEDIPGDWEIDVDKTRFWIVLSGLVDNARSYASQKVSIKVERVERETVGVVYLFRVRDDGPGVDPGIKDKLFQPGIRGKDKDGNKKYTGHGFGLFLSHRVIKRHGGSLYLNEEYLGGTEFVIEMPERFDISLRRENR